jgi:uncharacterized protein YraI
MKSNWKIMITVVGKNLYQFRFVTVILTLIFFIGVSQQSAFAQNNVVWNAEYFNNIYLTGPPALIRQDMSIDFNWGISAPLQGISADNFSVRWSTDQYFAEGTYRFYVLADDNADLRIDNPSQPQIDTFRNPSVSQIITTDVRLATGTHHIQVDYREVTGYAYIYVTWINLATHPTVPNFPVPQPLLYVGTPWIAQYYPNASFVGKPSFARSENTPSHYWGMEAPSMNMPIDAFSVRWSSYQLLNAGNYQLGVRADDGVRVYMDGILYLDAWSGEPATSHTTMVNVATGQHYFQVDYYEAGGIAFIDFAITPTFSTEPLIENPTSSETGTVIIATRLNVRSEPDPFSNILVKINRNETYPVIGRNNDQSWWQINVNGLIGWVYWHYLQVDNPNMVPIVSATSGPSLDQPSEMGRYFATTLVMLHIRSAPGTDNAILGLIPRYVQISIVGRTADNTWFQVNYGSITGWVSSGYVSLAPGTNLYTIPVTQNRSQFQPS